MYCDTDSIIVSERQGDHSIGLSDYLGGLTDEIAKDHGPQHFIEEFICCGPKNYAYKVSDGTCAVKIKGFYLNYQNAQELNMETMRTMVQNMNLNLVITLVNEKKITREPITRRIVNKREEKKYQLVYDKRKIINHGADTLPYGYTWSINDDCLANERDEHPTQPSNDLVTLYSDHYTPSENTLGTLFAYDNESDIPQIDIDDNEIDLMATSESDEDDSDQLTNEDRAFLVDDEEIDEDLSFYRTLQNKI